MTQHSNRKQRAREYAKAHDVPYTQALREVDQDPAPGQGSGQGAAPSAVWKIQPSLTDDPRARLPYPYFVTETGEVLRQDFWRGDPARLVGFTPTPEPGQDMVDVDTFVADPDAVVGWYPVFEDAAGMWATITLPVRTVTPVNGPDAT